jgi:hypothetical protein
MARHKVPVRWRCMVQPEGMETMELFVYARSERIARTLVRLGKLRSGTLSLESAKIVSVEQDMAPWTGRVLVDVAPARETRK